MAIESFEIVYDGPALTNHSMDVRELAPALLGIADLLQETNRALNGERAEVAVKVASEFKPGCFSVVLQVIQHAAAHAQGLFQPENLWTAKTLLEIIGLTGTPTIGLIKLIKWLRGRRVEKIEPTANGQVQISVGNDTIVVQNSVISIYNDTAARNALSQVLKPLDRAGIDRFEVRNDVHLAVEVVTESEVPFFATDSVEQFLEEKDDVGVFQIIKPSFDPKYKWMLSDGNATFGVYIKDQRFLDLLERRQVTFAKGDVLRVRFKRKVWRTESGLRTEYEILLVIEVVPAPRQLSFPLPPPPST